MKKRADIATRLSGFFFIAALLIMLGRWIFIMILPPQAGTREIYLYITILCPALFAGLSVFFLVLSWTRRKLHRRRTLDGDAQDS